MAPARLAGEVLLVQETLDQSLENRRAWVYNPGQRRVRRAPNVAFDNPGTNSDNLRTSDQFDMYNGSPQRYDWTLVGKKEILVPYNSYKLNSNTLKYADILKKNHINPDVARYELHRVWVVDSKLKAGQSHLYSRRTLYVDEDSWQILAVDCYDSRGQLYRVQEGHVINYYDVPALWTALETVYDLSQRPLPRAGPRQRRAAQPRLLAEAHRWPTTSRPPCSAAAFGEGQPADSRTGQLTSTLARLVSVNKKFRGTGMRHRFASRWSRRWRGGIAPSVTAQLDPNDAANKPAEIEPLAAQLAAARPGGRGHAPGGRRRTRPRAALR